MFVKVSIIVIFIISVKAEYASKIPCRTIEQCSGLLNPTQDFKCLNNICMCANTTTKMYEICTNKDIIVGAKASGLKRNCTLHEDCDHINGADCLPSDLNDKSKKICTCRANLVESPDGQNCLRVATEPGAPCKETIQCTAKLEGGECVSGFCQCQLNHHFNSYSSRCIRNKGFGEYCKPEEDSCYQEDKPHGENVMICTEEHRCRCIKHWAYRTGICEYSGAANIAIPISLVVLLLLAIRMF